MNLNRRRLLTPFVDVLYWCGHCFQITELEELDISGDVVPLLRYIVMSCIPENSVSLLQDGYKGTVEIDVELVELAVNVSFA